MKKWKEIYELFKKSNLLDEMDYRFIEISEKMLLTKKPIARKIVYSESWLSNWIKTTKARLFVEKLIDNKINGY